MKARQDGPTGFEGNARCGRLEKHRSEMSDILPVWMFEARMAFISPFVGYV